MDKWIFSSSLWESSLALWILRHSPDLPHYTTTTELGTIRCCSCMCVTVSCSTTLCLKLVQATQEHADVSVRLHHARAACIMQCILHRRTFLVLPGTWTELAEAAASTFWGDGVFSAAASSLPLLLLLLLLAAGAGSEDGVARGDDCLPLPEDTGVDVFAPFPEGITVRDLGFLHP